MNRDYLNTESNLPDRDQWIVMQLPIKDAALLLNISENTLYNLIKKKQLPAYRINRSYLIHKSDLLEWAIQHGKSISPELFSNTLTPESTHLPHLWNALSKNHVYYNINGSDSYSVIEGVINSVGEIPPAERNQVIAALVSRELLGSTAVGNGIAIPHVRNPIILNLQKPLIIIGFLAEPIDFAALDNKKVSILFTMLSTSTRIHLHLLARLSFVLQQPQVISVLTPNHSPQEIIQCIQAAEKALISSSGGDTNQ